MKSPASMSNDEPRELIRSVRPGIWLQRHAQVLVAGLGRLTREPIGTLMTIMVLAIALALPGGLYTLVQNLRSLSNVWDGTASISVFLRTEVDDLQAEHLAKRLRAEPGIAQVRVIDRASAMAEFRELSGFGEALDLLDENPLPAVLLVHPDLAQATPAETELLANRLRELPETELAMADLAWVQRLVAITAMLAHTTWVLGGFLAIGVLLIVLNTIRLEIFNRRTEIEVIKLVGGTDAFIRRPFLYEGLWLGLAAGLVAWVLLTLALAILSNPVDRLSGLYQSNFQLSGPSAGTSLSMMLAGTGLGLLGAWTAVVRHLREIEPS